MCGIVGIIGEQDSLLLEQMTDSLTHRGPDDRGLFREGRVGLGMRRLSIIDQSGGHQPMESADRRYVLVYNGEIFNAASLRLELERAGVRFKSGHSDTEVLLQLLIRNGVEALQQLNGMFAFAFFDRRKQTLLCARDRFGIKPFHYARQGNRFAFASEVKTLLLLPWVQKQPDLQSLFHFFTLNYIPGPKTAFLGIERLPPGAWMRVDLLSNAVTIEHWWSPAFSTSEPCSLQALSERLSVVFASAVKRWSVSDVPIGCLLSGGLDSSAIVSVLAEQGRKLKTYTVGFTGPGEEAWDELRLARQVAEKWGTEHHEIILDPVSLLDDLVDMVWALDEPYGGGLPSWAIFKVMGTDVKVAMTGTGGDELFGNYDKYFFLEGRLRSRVSGFGRRSAKLSLFKTHFVDRFYYAPDAEKRALMLSDSFANLTDTTELLWGHFNAGPAARLLRDRVVNTDIVTQLPDEFLFMTDRFSMAHSVEARTPFLDHELAAEVYAIGASVRLSQSRYKPLLRDMVAGLLPSQLMTAPKRGFVIPLKLWLRGHLEPLLRRLLAPTRLAEQGLIRGDFFERFAAPHLAGAADYTHRLWNMLMFQLWWEVYIVGCPRDYLRAEIQGSL